VLDDVCRQPFSSKEFSNFQFFFSSKILALLVWLVLLKKPIDGRVHVAGRGNQS
jgi:hypothetical protein